MHAGNIPNLFDILVQSRDIHPNTGAGPYRGYGPSCTEITSDGTSYGRTKVPNAIDVREIYARRATLPTFLVCGQSTWMGTKWLWWHHTLLFAVDHRTPGSPLFRIAADGY